MSAIVLSIISINQSNNALAISQETLDLEKQSNLIVLNVEGLPIENSYVSITYLPDTMKGIGSSVLTFKFEVQVDNLSSHKISIRDIYTESLLDGKLFELHFQGVNTGIFGPIYLEEDLDQREITLPITMDEGESLNFVTDFGLLLDEIGTEAIKENLNDSISKLTLTDVRMILGKAGTSLGRSEVEFQEFEGGMWTSSHLESPRIEVRIVVNTSFGTSHTTVIPIY